MQVRSVEYSNVSPAPVKSLHHLHHHYRLSSLRLFIPCIEQSVHSHCQHGGHCKRFSLKVMLRGKGKSGGSANRGKMKPIALVDSPTHVIPLTSATDLPPYGAQHRQDALWKGE
jgi:hypothetical protein